jgi:hypothetical protein
MCGPQTPSSAASGSAAALEDERLLWMHGTPVARPGPVGVCVFAVRFAAFLLLCECVYFWIGVLGGREGVCGRVEWSCACRFAACVVCMVLEKTPHDLKQHRRSCSFQNKVRLCCFVERQREGGRGGLPAAAACAREPGGVCSLANRPLPHGGGRLSVNQHTLVIFTNTHTHTHTLMWTKWEGMAFWWWSVCMEE